MSAAADTITAVRAEAWTAGDSAICDDRAAVRNRMRTSGKRRFPRLEISAAMFAPHMRPHRGCPGTEPRPGRGTVRPEQRCRPVHLSDVAAQLALSHVNRSIAG